MSELDVKPPMSPRAARLPRLGLVLSAVALLALWLAAALLYALLTRPTTSLTTLHLRGPRGVPVVMWTGSRDLVRLLQRGAESPSHD